MRKQFYYVLLVSVGTISIVSHADVVIVCQAMRKVCPVIVKLIFCFEIKVKICWCKAFSLLLYEMEAHEYAMPRQYFLRVQKA